MSWSIQVPLRAATQRAAARRTAELPNLVQEHRPGSSAMRLGTSSGTTCGPSTLRICRALIAACASTVPAGAAAAEIGAATISQRVGSCSQSTAPKVVVTALRVASAPRRLMRAACTAGSSRLSAGEGVWALPGGPMGLRELLREAARACDCSRSSSCSLAAAASAAAAEGVSMLSPHAMVQMLRTSLSLGEGVRWAHWKMSSARANAATLCSCSSGSFLTDCMRG
mmetsp:Transcript_9408/g.20046  ORF Transcript_9408/g.20046 Transcript_9408/m.20046 type:complete len:226 (-) Transcript_9408:32-709(-)